MIVTAVSAVSMSQRPSLASSQQLALICSLVTGAAMFLLRPVFRWRAETTFLGGFAGAILFFFLLIAVGNVRERRGATETGWIFIGLCEALALIVSVFVHPVCVTTCLLFSIPVVIYVKWAATQIKRGQGPVVRDVPIKKEQRPSPSPQPPAQKKDQQPSPPRATGKKSPRRS